MTHECPAADCTRDVPQTMLMCRQHWYMVPGPIRTAVWNAWDEGQGTGSPQHQAAITAAIRAVNEKLAAKGVTS